MKTTDKQALERYLNGEIPSVSTFIDEDTIIMGYGNINYYDFELPLPKNIIEDNYGTTSWRQYFKNKGYMQYISIFNKTGEKSITPYLSKKELQDLIKLNKDYSFQPM